MKAHNTHPVAGLLVYVKVRKVIVEVRGGVRTQVAPQQRGMRRKHLPRARNMSAGVHACMHARTYEATYCGNMQLPRPH